MTNTIPLFKVAPVDPGPVLGVLGSGMLGEGPVVRDFESNLCDYLETPFVTCVNSCTSALTLATRIISIREKLDLEYNGPSVFMSPFTMAATPCAVKAAGGDIVYGDTQEGGFCLNSSDDIIDEYPSLLWVDAILTTSVGGIIPVPEENKKVTGHWSILDAAHAFGSKWEGKHVHTLYDFTCYSFQSIKHLTCGDGGALVCGNKEDHELAQRLKWFGMSRDVPPGKTRLEHQMTQEVPEWGYKFHMNDVSAAIGLSNWDHAMDSIRASQGNAHYYQLALRKIDQISLLDVHIDMMPSWWVYGFFAQDRDRLLEHLMKNGVQASPMWPLTHRQEGFSGFTKTDSMKEVLRIEQEGIFIPNGWWVTTEDRHHIVMLIKNFYNVVENGGT